MCSVPGVWLITFLEYFKLCPFFWIFIITCPPRGTSSCSYPIMVISQWRLSEPCPYFKREGGSCHLLIFMRLIEGVGFPLT